MERLLEKMEDKIERLEKLYNEFIDLKIDIENLKSDIEKTKENNKETFEKFNVFKHMSEFLNGKIAINCRTEESAFNFVNSINKLGLIWSGRNDNNEIVTNWKIFNTDTCYTIFKGFYNGNSLGFGNISYYKNNNIKIIIFE